jgi:hypothetical protein
VSVREHVLRTFLSCVYVSADTTRLPCSAARASCSCCRKVGAASSTCNHSHHRPFDQRNPGDEASCNATPELQL